MKKQIRSILLALCMVLCLVPTAVLAADEMHNVTVKAAAGGKVSTDGTNWSDSVVVSAANGTTLGDRVQYTPDEGYKLDGVTAVTAIKKVVASAANMIRFPRLFAICAPPRRFRQIGAAISRRILKAENEPSAPPIAGNTEI